MAKEKKRLPTFSSEEEEPRFWDENDPSDRPGMGIEFLDMGEHEATALNSYLNED